MTDACQLPPCVVCGGATRTCLDLGSQPLANALLATPDEPYDTFPLGLATCDACSHGQLTHFVAPEQLFKNYLYASGTGGALNPFFQWFSATLAAVLPRGSRVLEIACNDGSLLDCLRDAGFQASGVDPAENLTAIAIAKGHEVLTGFFPETRPSGKFDAIVAMNVCAHTPEPRALMQGVKELLATDGAAIIQTSQAFMLMNGEFDTIYHEHYSFFTPASMRSLAESCGLQLETRQIFSVHGNSLVSILRHAGVVRRAFDFNGGQPFAVAWPDPEPDVLSLGLERTASTEAYGRFASQAVAVMDRARTRVKDHQANGGQLALVGVAAKALTFITAAGIKPDHFLDDATLKVGRFVPGAARAIVPMRAATALPDDTLFMIGAWNFADALAAKVRALRAGAATQFLVCLPQLREFN
ncbi:MAG TPA: class I SAM-dependent methyltransferase [Hyphomicrobium sp.]|mgnify:CR=1 FL=1|nr:class I SAM-dependent methyltransferase [Hyphomicrobium sp.]